MGAAGRAGWSGSGAWRGGGRRRKAGNRAALAWQQQHGAALRQQHISSEMAWHQQRSGGGMAATWRQHRVMAKWLGA